MTTRQIKLTKLEKLLPIAKAQLESAITTRDYIQSVKTYGVLLERYKILTGYDWNPRRQAEVLGHHD